MMRKTTPSKTPSQPASVSVPSALFPTTASIQSAAAAAPAKVAAKAAPAKPAVKPVAAKAAAVKVVAKPAVKVDAVKVTVVKPVVAKAVVVKAVAKDVAAKPVVARVRRPAAPVIDLDARERARKPKLVRDSFTMPEQEYAVLGQVKKACLKAGFEIKKSELLRIGVALINQIDLVTLKTVLVALPQLKTGRPKKN
jgi:hypothetical protein